MTEASRIHRALEAIPKFGGTDFHTCDDKIRAGVSLYAVQILYLLDGATCPAAKDTNVTEVATWHRNNARLYSLLFLATEGSACITVKMYKRMGSPRGPPSPPGTTATTKRLVARVARTSCTHR